jgi:isoleucyl-tRNA synthetase
MVDYREEIRLGKQILARVIEAYRKIRNTMRYLVSNLYDFDPRVDRVPTEHMEEVDRFILGRYADVATQIVSAYDDYDFPTIFQALNSFATIELSALYSDISKDRLYTFGAHSKERRSAQTAMYVIADGLTRLMAPILPVTADELWRHVPAASEASVHLAQFPSRDALAALRNAELESRWTRLVALRERVLAQIEPLRKDKHIGSSLQAKVVLSATPRELVFLESYASQLPMLFIVSDVELKPAPPDVDAHEEGEPRIAIERAGGTKCERCWRYVSAISADPSWAGLCDRCQEALAEPIRR